MPIPTTKSSIPARRDPVAPSHCQVSTPRAARLWTALPLAHYCETNASLLADGFFTMTEMSFPNDLPRRRSRLPLLGLLLTLVAPIVYMALVGFPTLRATGLAAFVTAGLGCVLGFVGVLRGTNRRGRIFAGASAAMTALYLAAFFGLAALPATASTLAVGEPVPSFVLPDQNGQSVALDEAHAHGPALLVFYRGHW